MTVQLAFPFISPSHLGGEAPTDTIIFLCHVPQQSTTFLLDTNTFNISGTLGTKIPVHQNPTHTFTLDTI